VARQIDTTVMTMFDVEDLGIRRAMDIALEIAWKGADAVYLSFTSTSSTPATPPKPELPSPVA
jgi:agmatinase